MWYIRFLKVPECEVLPGSKDGITYLTITFTISITTDLGDEFLVGNDFSDYANLLTATLVEAELEDSPPKKKFPKLAESYFSWESGKRSVTHRFNATLRGNRPISSLRLVISPRKNDANLENVISGRVSRVLGIWSDVFDSESGKSMFGRVQRQFPVGRERFLHIWEETGESIARHIW